MRPKRQITPVIANRWITLDPVLRYGSTVSPRNNPTWNPELENTTKPASGALVAGGITAILASACCVAPLVLVMMGFGGAWLGNLAVLAPYRPIFLGAALIAMFFAWRRIYRPVAACAPGDACAVPQVRTIYKVLFWVVAALVVVALTFPYLAPLFY